jgi:hypothetical protein
MGLCQCDRFNAHKDATLGADEFFSGVHALAILELAGALVESVRAQHVAIGE